MRIAGSAGYDLMVWRGIDIHMAAEASTWADWAYLVAEIARQLQDAGLVLHKVSYLNDYVAPQPLGAGLHWGLEFQDFAAQSWTCGTSKP